MIPSELTAKIKKIFDIHRDQTLINNTYFNPTFADRFLDKLPELKELGFNMAKTETESEEGTIISGKLTAPTGEILDLGSVLLDGKSIVIKKSLQLPDKIISFVEDNIPKEF